MKHKTNPMIVLVVFAIALAGVYSLVSQQTIGDGSLKKFSSYSELTNFVASNLNSYYGNDYATGKVTTAAETSSGSASQTIDSSSRSSDYSSTNIQVEGVDEPDIIKNDGKYIYTVSGRNVVIVDAFPAESARNISQIQFNGTPSEIFLDGDRMVVMGYSDYTESSSIASDIGILPRYYVQRTFINVYDISDRANPVLVRNVTVDGSYYDARMIDGYAYVIANQPVYYSSPSPIALPVIQSGISKRTVAATDIYYFDTPDSSYVFTNIVSVNVRDSSQEVNSKTFLMGYSEQMYVSASSIYVTYTKRLSEYDFYDKIVDEAIMPSMPLDVQLKINSIRASDGSDYEKIQEIGKELQAYLSTLNPEQSANVMKDIEARMITVEEEISKELERTIVHKISIGNGSVDYSAQGNVPGYVLNQFSMDEYNGHLRIATTTGNWRTQNMNNVYVLDSDMKIVGSVEDLAKDERIYSARFMGDRAYLVTFRQVDPLFVLDLSNPSSPQVLGYLKVNGVSDYLHPYDETHIIGLGRDATDQGRTTGLKLSLFDVSDVANPVEVSKYVINSTYSYSDAQYDHKAFLFSRDRNLLAIPVSITEISEISSRMPGYWQGLYVFNVNLDSGFALKGTVTHQNQTNETYYDYGSQITRSLYMDDVLYTLSSKMIKASSLSDLSQISTVALPYTDYYYPYLKDSVVSVGATSVAPAVGG